MGKGGLFHEEVSASISEQEAKAWRQLSVGTSLPFICVNGENNETLSMGKKNVSRFKKMIMEEMEEVPENDGEDSDDET
ncbi:hypothetical protein Tco_0858517 [Tanacetum coccineum]|uniref:Uncharacterized protein n=1 Tax=Tanacetum coccineum TaxID=301880 RepID=A0ABQ5B9C4_9ASTR